MLVGTKKIRKDKTMNRYKLHSFKRPPLIETGLFVGAKIRICDAIYSRWDKISSRYGYVVDIKDSYIVQMDADLKGEYRYFSKKDMEANIEEYVSE